MGKFRINDAMLSISGSTKIQTEEIIYDLGFIKSGEEPSILADQVPIIIFERQKKKVRDQIKTSKDKQKKYKNFKIKSKSGSITSKKDNLPDPLSPFAILKSIKIK